MVIKLFRHTFTDTSTIGTMVLGQKNWHTIEDKDRGLTQQMTLSQVQAIKVYAQTCIPYGMYKVLITQSARFSKKQKRPVFTPEIINVTGFTGIRIHPANYASQLEGCIAPGRTVSKNMVGMSKIAYQEVLELINTSLKSGEDVWIEITKTDD